MSKFTLFSLLAVPCEHAKPITINGITGLLLAVAREDGSGRSFNVTIATRQGNRTVHLRTVD